MSFANPVKSRRNDMNVINKFSPRHVMSVVFIVIGYLVGSVAVSAQQKTLDYFGEINDAEHPAGYREYVEMGCWQCHGFQGQGAGGPALAPPLPYEAFAALTRRPVNVMPAYSPNQLDEVQLKLIYNYLENVAPAPDITEIPQLSGNR